MPLPSTVDIEDSDFLIRRVKKLQIDDNGFPNIESFSLRKKLPSGDPEVSLSVQLERLLNAPQDALNGIPNTQSFELFRFEPDEAKKLKFGVCHTPSKKDSSHSSICGYFTEIKSEILRKKTAKI